MLVLHSISVVMVGHSPGFSAWSSPVPPPVPLGQNLLPSSLPSALLFVIPGLVAVGAVAVFILGLTDRYTLFCLLAC